MNFILIAFGSANELQTHLDIAIRLGFVPSSDMRPVQDLLLEILKMLKVMAEKLRS